MDLDKTPKLGISEEPQTIGQLGTSPLGYIAILCGLTSLIAPFSLKLVIVPVFAAAICLAMYLRIVRNELVRGSGLALIGLGLALFSGAWTISSNAIRFQGLTNTAGSYAEEFANRLSAGQTSDALQLTLRIDKRPIAGTDLDTFFKGREESQAFLALPATQMVKNSGAEAKWRFVGGTGIEFADRKKSAIRVLLQNENKPAEKVVVVLIRELVENSREAQAGWHVAKLEMPEESI